MLPSQPLILHTGKSADSKSKHKPEPKETQLQRRMFPRCLQVRTFCGMPAGPHAPHNKEAPQNADLLKALSLTRVARRTGELMQRRTSRARNLRKRMRRGRMLKACLGYTRRCVERRRWSAVKGPKARKYCPRVSNALSKTVSLQQFPCNNYNALRAAGLLCTLEQCFVMQPNPSWLWVCVDGKF
jgi:hypothetical protein